MLFPDSYHRERRGKRDLLLVNFVMSRILEYEMNNCFKCFYAAFRRIVFTGGFVFYLFSAPAFAAEMFDLRVSREGDLVKDCGEISQEVSTMESIMEHAAEVQTETELAGKGINVVKSVGTYLIGSTGGALGIIAAGVVVSHFADEKIESAEDLQKAAGQRRSFMMGVYNAKGCEGPFKATAFELAGIEPAAGDGAVYGPPDLRPRKPVYND